jgi:hypothetical protein
MECDWEYLLLPPIGDDDLDCLVYTRRFNFSEGVKSRPTDTHTRRWGKFQALIESLKLRDGCEITCYRGASIATEVLLREMQQ